MHCNEDSEREKVSPVQTFVKVVHVKGLSIETYTIHLIALKLAYPKEKKKEKAPYDKSTTVHF